MHGGAPDGSVDRPALVQKLCLHLDRGRRADRANEAISQELSRALQAASDQQLTYVLAQLGALCHQQADNGFEPFLAPAITAALHGDFGAGPLTQAGTHWVSKGTLEQLGLLPLALCTPDTAADGTHATVGTAYGNAIGYDGCGGYGSGADGGSGGDVGRGSYSNGVGACGGSSCGNGGGVVSMANRGRPRGLDTRLAGLPARHGGYLTAAGQTNRRSGSAPRARVAVEQISAKHSIFNTPYAPVLHRFS